jgi:hypothetical protein
MKTNEYLWWIETIRQNEFRRMLPINITIWVAWTIFLIILIIVLIALPTKINSIFLFVGFVSFFVSSVLQLISSALSKRTDKRIEAVKKLWYQDIEVKDISKELLWFYALEKKS